MSEHEALYNFFQTMGDTAVDIYWGNYPDIEEQDRETLTGEECQQAFDAACAEMAYDDYTADWYLQLPAKLADYYGRHLKAVLVQRQIEAARRERGDA